MELKPVECPGDVAEGPALHEAIIAAIDEHWHSLAHTICV